MNPAAAENTPMGSQRKRREMQFPTCEKSGSKPKKKESKHAKGRRVLMMKNGFNIGIHRTGCRGRIM
jgi:hypothetical protein